MSGKRSLEPIVQPTTRRNFLKLRYRVLLYTSTEDNTKRHNSNLRNHL